MSKDDMTSNCGTKGVFPTLLSSISDVGDSITGKVRNNVCRTSRVVCGLKKKKEMSTIKIKISQ